MFERQFCRKQIVYKKKNKYYILTENKYKVQKFYTSYFRSFSWAGNNIILCYISVACVKRTIRTSVVLDKFKIVPMYLAKKRKRYSRKRWENSEKINFG